MPHRDRGACTNRIGYRVTLPAKESRSQHVIIFQFPAQGERLVVCYTVQKFPEAIAMVHLYRMAKFVEEDVIDQMPREQHQG